MPEPWDSYLVTYHDTNPGITEDCLSEARDAAGRSPYDWLVDAVPAGAATVVDLACGSEPLA
ncbi:MAG: class I SAM-dependent methyltransferase, partial [Actinomycetota bacterium]|nr:class I SAM-dependent methyltransferase [Actinomycetota bacterium]